MRSVSFGDVLATIIVAGAVAVIALMILSANA